jgi:hypothetical protein
MSDITAAKNQAYMESPSAATDYPTIAWVKARLRSLGFKGTILDSYIVGSEAKGTAKPTSDLDIAVIITPKRGVDALKFTERWHQGYQRMQYPTIWNGRNVDFQFFYPEDPELGAYSKLPLGGNEKEVSPDKRIGVPKTAAVKPNLAAFMSDITSQTFANPFNGREAVWNESVGIECSPFDGRVHLSSIRSFTRSEGNASKALDWLTGLAQKHGVEIECDAQPFGQGGLGKTKLTQWYKRHGFVTKDGMLVFSPKVEKTAAINAQDIILYHGTNSEDDFDAVQPNPHGIIWLGEYKTAEKYAKTHYKKGEARIFEVGLKDSAKVLDLRDLSSPLVQEIKDRLQGRARIFYGNDYVMGDSEYQNRADFTLLEGSEWVLPYLLEKGIDAVVVRDNSSGSSTYADHDSMAVINPDAIESQRLVQVRKTAAYNIDQEEIEVPNYMGTGMLTIPGPKDAYEKVCFTIANDDVLWGAFADYLNGSEFEPEITKRMVALFNTLPPMKKTLYRGEPRNFEEDSPQWDGGIREILSWAANSKLASVYAESHGIIWQTDGLIQGIDVIDVCDCRNWLYQQESNHPAVSAHWLVLSNCKAHRFTGKIASSKVSNKAGYDWSNPKPGTVTLDSLDQTWPDFTMLIFQMLESWGGRVNAYTGVKEDLSSWMKSSEQVPVTLMATDEAFSHIESWGMTGEDGDDRGPEHIEALIEAMKNGVHLPPALVSASGRIVDGRHRIRAAKKLNLPSVPVISINDCYRKDGKTASSEGALDEEAKTAKRGLTLPQLEALLAKFRDEYFGDEERFSAGDCDAFGFALVTFLQSKGIPCTPLVISRETQDEDGEEVGTHDFSHLVVKALGSTWDYKGSKAFERWESSWYDEIGEENYFNISETSFIAITQLKAEKQDPPTDTNLQQDVYAKLQSLSTITKAAASQGALEVQAPKPWAKDRFTIFLAGAIDGGAADNWQTQVVKALADYNVTILNPRRDDWDNSWGTTLEDDRFREQVAWEHHGLETADFRTFVFLEDSKAPVTMLELGEQSDKDGIVCCPEEFYRSGNVEMTAILNKLPIVDTVEDMIQAIKTVLDAKGLGKGAKVASVYSDNELYKASLTLSALIARDQGIIPKGDTLTTVSPVTLYHGTRPEYVESIEIKGLKPRGDKTYKGEKRLYLGTIDAGERYSDSDAPIFEVTTPVGTVIHDSTWEAVTAGDGTIKGLWDRIDQLPKDILLPLIEMMQAKPGNYFSVIKDKLSKLPDLTPAEVSHMSRMLIDTYQPTSYANKDMPQAHFDSSTGVGPVYHGTKYKFKDFDLGEIGKDSGNRGFLGAGIYFSADESVASAYGTVKAYHLNTRNPLIIDEPLSPEAAAILGRVTDTEDFFVPGETSNEEVHNALADVVSNSPEAADDLTAAVEEAGYDAVFWNGMREIVVFDPKLINPYKTKGKKTASPEDIDMLKAILDLTDAEKAVELARHLPEYFYEWIEEHHEELIPAFGEGYTPETDYLEDYSKFPTDIMLYFGEDATSYLHQNDPAGAPSFIHMDYVRDVNEEWLVHFTDYPGDIAVQGFTSGIDNPDTLGLTTYFPDAAKKRGGYNFAYDPSDVGHHWKPGKYGSEAVVFIASGVEVYHHGDEEPQIIFWGKDAHDIIPIRSNGDYDWTIWDDHAGEPFFESNEITECIDWCQENYKLYFNPQRGAELDALKEEIRDLRSEHEFWEEYMPKEHSTWTKYDATGNTVAQSAVEKPGYEREDFTLEQDHKRKQRSLVEIEKELFLAETKMKSMRGGKQSSKSAMALPHIDVSDVEQALDDVFEHIQSTPKSKHDSAFSILHQALRKVEVGLMPCDGKCSKGISLSSYITNGYFDAYTKVHGSSVCVEYADGFIAAFNLKKNRTTQELNALKKQILILVTHERSHAEQFRRMKEDPINEGKYDYELDKLLGNEQSLSYLAQPREIAAYAVHAVYELRQAGMPDEKILSDLRKYKAPDSRDYLAQTSAAFRKYRNMDDYVQKKRDIPGDVDPEFLKADVFRKFVEKMVQYIQQPKTAANVPNALIDWSKPKKGQYITLDALEAADQISWFNLQDMLGSYLTSDGLDMRDGNKRIAVAWVPLDSLELEVMDWDDRKPQTATMARDMKEGVKFAPGVIELDNNHLKDGNHRAQAARLCGYTHIPVVSIADCADPTQLRAALDDSPEAEDEKRDKEIADFDKKWDTGRACHGTAYDTSDMTLDRIPYCKECEGTGATLRKVASSYPKHQDVIDYIDDVAPYWCPEGSNWDSIVDAQQYELKDIPLSTLAKAKYRPLTRETIDMGMVGNTWTFQPIVLDDDYSVIDGMHRVADAYHEGKISIPALVRMASPPISEGKMSSAYKSAYLSPKEATISLTVDLGQRATATLTLDLGIPNFSVFDIKIPIEGASMEESKYFIGQAFEALLDDVSLYLLSMGYPDKMVGFIGKAALKCFDAISVDDATDNGMMKDDMIRFYESNFAIPPEFAEETLDKVVTAAGDITQTPAFKAWFKQSEVVNADGSPAIMYHATQAEIGEFRPFTHFGTQDAANQRYRDTTSFYEEIGNLSRGHGSNIMPVYLSIQNALRLPDLATINHDGEVIADIDEEDFEDHDEYGDDERRIPRGWEAGDTLGQTLLELGIFDIDEFEEFYDDTDAIKRLATKGYDGIVYQNAVEDAGQDSWIVFSPNQVKSSVGNSGTFDSKDNKITASATQRLDNRIELNLVEMDPLKDDPAAAINMYRSQSYKSTPKPYKFEVIKGPDILGIAKDWERRMLNVIS